MTDKIEWHPNGTLGPWSALADMRTDERSTDEYLAGWNIESIDGEIVGIEGIIPGDNAETNARAIAEVPAMVQALRSSAEHIELMLTGIANGNAEAGRRFAEKDPIYTNIRAILDRIDGKA